MAPRKIQRTKKGRQYFTKIHENAIIKYAQTEDPRIRTHLYVTYIQPAFDEMVDKIVFTYKFTTLPNITDLREECKIWLTTILNKYDSTKGSKAFSYFSVITKNWFIHKVKKNSQRMRREVQIDASDSVFVKNLEVEHLSNDAGYLFFREQAEFWQNFWNEIESWDEEALKPNEKKVLNAVKILFENCDDIEIFNKKAVYLYLRELTGLNTKQVVNSLNKMRSKYGQFKKSWNEGQI